MWSSIRRDLESADVELVIVGGLNDSASRCEASSSYVDSWSSAGTTIKAHSLVLSEASPVLKASLASEMQEGKTHVIPVPGASIGAMEVLLSVIYLGRTPAPPPCMNTPTKRDWSIG